MQSGLFNRKLAVHRSVDVPPPTNDSNGYSALADDSDDDDGDDEGYDEVDGNKKKALSRVFRPTYAQVAAKASESKDARSD